MDIEKVDEEEVSMIKPEKMTKLSEISNQTNETKIDKAQNSDLETEKV